jgi:capsular polysaccharide biosynthesis protein
MRSFRQSFGPRRYSSWLAVVTLAAAGAAAAAGYALTAPKQYRATAQLLVSPVPANDTTFTGIDVLRDSGGRRTAAASAAALVRSPLVADAVRALLGLRRSRDSLLGALETHVVDSSDVVAVTAEDSSANGAAQIANAFADTLVNERTAQFQSEVAAAVRRYTQQVGGMTKAEQATPAGTELTQRLVALQGVEGEADPTLKHAGQATPPASPIGPRVIVDIGIGAASGAVLGLLVALLLAGATRVRRAGAGGPTVYGAALYDAGVSERAAERLADRLEQRLAARESALAARERDLQRALEEVRAAQAAASDTATQERTAAGELAAREAALAERVAAVTKRELELARRAAELAVREAEPGPEPLPEPGPEPPAEREPARTGVDKHGAGKAGAYNLLRLERLVDDRRGEFPDRAEEWSSYLYFLREYAAPDGSVPASFDTLIEATFAELVA